MQRHVGPACLIHASAALPSLRRRHRWSEATSHTGQLAITAVGASRVARENVKIVAVWRFDGCRSRRKAQQVKPAPLLIATMHLYVLRFLHTTYLLMCWLRSYIFFPFSTCLPRMGSASALYHLAVRVEWTGRLFFLRCAGLRRRSAAHPYLTAFKDPSRSMYKQAVSRRRQKKRGITEVEVGERGDAIVFG
ncbi:hypothetical protein CI102_1654 [Trichoderma harzianum]|nr:hypothetical protein CI102_1654 [Trichoderma harzianum]